MGPLLRDDLALPEGEALRLEVLEALLEGLAARFHPAILYFRTVPALTDARAFRWHGCIVEVLYTYLVRLPKDVEDLLPTFHRRVRTYLRKAEGTVDVRVGGKDLCGDIHTFVASRFRSQGKEFGPPREYLSTLFEALGPSAYQPIGAYTEAGLGAGAIVTFHGARASFWQHASGPSGSRLPLTDYMIWYAMKLASERGATEFELVGANTPRLVNFKTKFAPALEQFFEISKTTTTGKIARAIYARTRA